MHQPEQHCDTYGPDPIPLVDLFRRILRSQDIDDVHAMVQAFADTFYFDLTVGRDEEHS